MSAGPAKVCANTAPPCTIWVLKVVLAGKTNGELLTFCCAFTSIEAVSKRIGPLKNREPLAETASTGEIAGTVRLANTVDEFTSNTKAVRAVVDSCTPTIVSPSCEACRRAWLAKAITPPGGGNAGAEGAVGAIGTA